MNQRSSSHRRALALVAAVALAIGAITTAATSMADHTRDGGYAAAADLGARCQEVIASTVAGVPASCAHSDKAPAGVDVDKHVATAVLEARTGAAASAVDAAQDEGVPVPAELAAVTNQVPCDGDGTSGYRVQAIYVVTADKPNRYAAVSDQIKQWAAGVNTVFNLSAAKTGGVRDVRFVSASNGDGTCSPTVLNVTVPAGSFASFGATITAMQNLGFTSATRKYLMWVDGTGQCGIAQTYVDSRADQANYNNGMAPQFARIDTACWGQSQSVEAHELSHTMGSVQKDAPHATAAGHCYDESDRMCYADGGGKAMQQVCAPDQETLFDCNNDDYYSTFPASGSYLATHWNTASSRFLIGGGDGVGGGSAGVPTTLGGTVTVNNPVVPGLPTQVQANLEVPSGRTTTIAWTSTRKDCVFSSPTSVQTTVTCDARTTSAAAATATVVDSTGAKLVRTVPLTFSTAARAAAPSTSLDGSTSAYTACPSGKGVLTTRVLDTTTQKPVQGLGVAWFRQVGAAKAVQVATATTDATGVGVSAPVAMTAGTYSAKTIGTVAFPAVASSTIDVTVASGTCTTALSGSVSDDEVHAGDPVTVSGELTRDTGDGTDLPAAGEKVSIYALADGKTTWALAASATTAADGSYTTTVKPLGSEKLQARFAAHTGFAAANASEEAVTVTPWTTDITVSSAPAAVMAGDSVTLTGTLTQSADSVSAVMPSSPVKVTYPMADGKTATASATTNASGTYTVVAKPTGSGTVTVAYAGKPGWAADTATRALTVKEWSTALTTTTSATEVMAGTPLTLTGSLTQTGDPGQSAMKSAAIKVTYPLAGGKTATATTTTNVSGGYTVTVKPTGSGTVTVTYAGKVGWAADTETRTLTVHEWSSHLTLASTRNATTGYVTSTGILTVTNSSGVSTPLASASVVVTYPTSATRTASTTVRTNASGVFTASVKQLVSGTVSARYAGLPGWAAAEATPVTVTW
ncbi:hypothetical protein ABLE68_04920 [Nocardioides sp. CN2-186]|uniref:hypothetical protein n=1 Tax=Nocardioides tweenelious TaxID=3156607 RepID=UPI0032B5EF79